MCKHTLCTRTHIHTRICCTGLSLGFPLLACLQFACVFHVQLSMYMISLYLQKNLHDSLSLSLSAPVGLCRSPFPSLCLSLQKYSILLFFFFLPTACLCLPFSIPPSFPHHRFWLASVKLLNRKVCMHACACA